MGKLGNFGTVEVENVTCSMRWNCTSMENMEGDICIIDLESTVRQNNPVG